MLITKHQCICGETFVVSLEFGLLKEIANFWPQIKVSFYKDTSDHLRYCSELPVYCQGPGLLYGKVAHRRGKALLWDAQFEKTH